MEITITSKEGATLKTENKHCKENISVKVQTQELNITPSITEQVKEGLYNKITVQGDENLSSENIIKGKSIFGVEGSAQTANLRITNCDYLFYYGARMDCYTEIMNLIDNITSATSMFTNANITNDDFTKLDFSNCKKMNGFCTGNKNLTEVNIKNMNLQNVETLQGAFNNCDNLVKMDLTGLNIPKVTNLNNFLEASNKVETISFENGNLEKVESMQYLVNGYNGKKISFKNCNLKSIKNMYYAFCQTRSIEEIDLTGCDFSNLDSLDSTFYSCSVKNLIADFSKTYKLRTVNRMFNYSCYNLTSLSEINGQSINIINDMFGSSGNNKSLENWSGIKDLGKAFTMKQANAANYTFNISLCSKLTYESLLSILNNLYDLNLTYDVANGGTLYTQKLILGSTNLAKLTAEEIRNSDCKTVGLFLRKEKIMKLFTYTKPRMIVADEGKQIRAKNDVYFKDEDGEHFPHYATTIFVPDMFTEEQMNEEYVEEIKN